MSFDKKEAPLDINLFGEEVERDWLLRDKFIEPPFSTLDARSGNWQSRKQRWLELGIRSEIGRNSTIIHKGLAQGLNAIDPRESYTGTSVFDSALTELMYYWFCPDGGEILDPFAGGSVRGIVANKLGYKYTGIELRQEQVDSNQGQGRVILPYDNQPTWICGDSEVELAKLTQQYDFVFSCPPYLDLEVYSDDPNDLSTMCFDDFMSKYRSIIGKSLSLLKYGGFAVFVVGDVRDKNGYYQDFVGETKRVFMELGAKYYNDMVLLENGLNTAAMRADKQFSAGRKVVKTHQNVLCFKKI